MLLTKLIKSLSKFYFLKTIINNDKITLVTITNSISTNSSLDYLVDNTPLSNYLDNFEAEIYNSTLMSNRYFVSAPILEQFIGESTLKSVCDIYKKIGTQRLEKKIKGFANNDYALSAYKIFEDQLYNVCQYYEPTDFYVEKVTEAFLSIYDLLVNPINETSSLVSNLYSKINQYSETLGISKNTTEIIINAAITIKIGGLASGIIQISKTYGDILNTQEQIKSIYTNTNYAEMIVEFRELAKNSIEKLPQKYQDSVTNLLGDIKLFNNEEIKRMKSNQAQAQWQNNIIVMLSYLYVFSSISSKKSNISEFIQDELKNSENKDEFRDSARVYLLADKEISSIREDSPYINQYLNLLFDKKDAKPIQIPLLEKEIQDALNKIQNNNIKNYLKTLKPNISSCMHR